MLNLIVETTRGHVASRKLFQPLQALRIDPGNFAFSRSIIAAEWALIAECKLASPSKGMLCQTHTVPELAELFTLNGAAALSVHTSPFFSGRLEDIAAARKVSGLPILRKDFIVDEYQVYEARAAGADAILLIAAILDDASLGRFLAVAGELGMDCLVEVHTQSELERILDTEATLVGINNRDLTNFATDIGTTFRLFPHCDPGWQVISESGIQDASQAQRLKLAGIKGALIGEGLVRAPDIASQTRSLAKLETTGGRIQHA